MPDELTAELAAIGRDIHAALHLELRAVTPSGGGWLAVRDRVFESPTHTWRPRWSPRRMALVVAAAVATTLLLVGAALATGRIVALLPHAPHSGQQLVRPAESAELSQAERTLGFHVLRVVGVPGARLVGVETLGPATAPNGAPVPAPPGVRLTYQLGGTKVVVGEFDTGGKSSAGSVVGGDRPGLRETVAGHDTIVTYDSQGRVTGMLWTTGGLTVAVGFNPGVPHQVAVDFVEHLR